MWMTAAVIGIGVAAITIFRKLNVYSKLKAYWERKKQARSSGDHQHHYDEEAVVTESTVLVPNRTTRGFGTGSTLTDEQKAAAEEMVANGGFLSFLLGAIDVFPSTDGIDLNPLATEEL